LTLPYLAYALTVLSAGFQENALRRAPISYVGLAQELGLRNAGITREMLNLSQAQELARVALHLAGEARTQALAYAEAALAVVRGQATPRELQESPELLAASSPLPSAWQLPSLDLFEVPEKTPHLTKEDIKAMEQQIQITVNSFIPAEVRSDYTQIGPRVIRFGVLPTGTPVLVSGSPKRDSTGQVVYAKRTRISQITARQDDIQAALAVKAIRMLPPVPGEHFVGIEVPNPRPANVPLCEVLASKEYQMARAKSKLAFALGRDVAGLVQVCDIAKAPHLLIAGTTGAGKSMLLNTLIAAILTQATPDDVRLLMIDPKMVELTLYDGIPHLLSPVVTNVEKAGALLEKAIAEMERRYRLLSQLGVRNLEGYRKLRAERLAQGDTSLANLPAIVIIIDELADLMMSTPDEVEDMICRLAQKARAIGIHLVIATQRPSVEVITGLIKANIPTRISFMVNSWIDSKTIIDAAGAEKLLGRGDMLYLPSDASHPERIQGAWMSDSDAESLTAYWRAQPEARTHPTTAHQEALPFEDTAALESAEDEQDEQEPEVGGSDDPDEALVQAAIELMAGKEWISASLFARTFKIGSTRAGRIMDILVARGMVSTTANGPRNTRRVLLSPDEHLEQNEEVSLPS